MLVTARPTKRTSVALRRDFQEAEEFRVDEGTGEVGFAARSPLTQPDRDRVSKKARLAGMSFVWTECWIASLRRRGFSFTRWENSACTHDG